MLLKEIVRQNRAAFFPGSSDWKDAIRKSCQPLVDTGCATPAYAQRIIECVAIYRYCARVGNSSFYERVARCVSDCNFFCAI